MSALAVRPVPPEAGESIPGDLVPFSRFASEIGVHLNTLHRQRLRPEDPMPAWRICGQWRVSRAEFAVWSARRSGRAEKPVSAGSFEAAPPHSPRRRKQIQAAIDDCARRGC